MAGGLGVGGLGAGRPWSALFFRNRRIFGNFNASSEHFRTFAVGKDKAFEFYRKIFELAPLLLYRCHDASARSIGLTIKNKGDSQKR